MKNNLILITGPTAAGKTQTSIDVAEYLINKNIPAEIINFDSILFYKELNIGSAKPTVLERRNIPHHLIDIQSIQHPINANNFIEIAKNKIVELFDKNSVVILVGGSAFYLRALLKGMYVENQGQEPKKKYEEQGIEFVVDYLKANDPESLIRLHINDHYRLIRAYEFHLNNGYAISQAKEKSDSNNPYDFHSNIFNAEILNFYLDIKKEEHLKIIEKRTQRMIQDGLIEEVKKLLVHFSKNLKPLQSIGYKETIEFLNGDIHSEKDLEIKISISTRQLAKSQRTFFKKIIPKTIIDPTESRNELYTALDTFINNLDIG